MNFNCNKIIISGFNLEGSVFNRYYQTILTTLLKNLPHNLTENFLLEKLKISSSQNFSQQVLDDKKNVGICLAQAGVLQCAQLNSILGIRAALTHDKYIAQMCRKVLMYITKHNDANVCIISCDCIGQKLAGQIVLDYLRSDFDNQERNMIRVNKMKDLGQKYFKKV